MSCSKWRWTPMCDGRPCVGDCDLCGFDPIEEKCKSCRWYKKFIQSVPYGSTSGYFYDYECTHPNGDECSYNEFWEEQE